MDTGEQFVLIEWFGQVANHAGVQRLRPDPLVVVRRDQNRRNRRAGSDQMPMEFEPCHPRHLHICDQAGGAVPTLGSDKALARRERRCRVAERSHKSRQSLPNRLIIIDDRNHDFLRQALASPIGLKIKSWQRRPAIAPEFG